jgi:hypothetical protein
MEEQIGWVGVDAEGAGLFEFGLAVSTGEETDAEGAAAAGGEHIPNAIADDDTVLEWERRGGWRRGRKYPEKAWLFPRRRRSR